jgi:hypothetical protein
LSFIGNTKPPRHPINEDGHEEEGDEDEEDEPAVVREPDEDECALSPFT